MVTRKIKTVFTSVDSYLAAQSPVAAQKLQQMRKCILEAAPGCTELINYNIPAFALVPGGKREQQIMMAGFARHVGLYPHPEIIEAFADQLKGYRAAKGSVQFPLDQPLPEDLIRAMVRERSKQLGASN